MMEKKKIYFTPEIDIMLLKTADMMKASEPSDIPLAPGASSSAPVHRTQVF